MKLQESDKTYVFDENRISLEDFTGLEHEERVHYLHSETEPAYVYPNGEQWFLNGQLHREDGAAYQDCGVRIYHLFDKYFSPEEYEEAIKLLQEDPIKFKTKYFDDDN